MRLSAYLICIIISLSILTKTVAQTDSDGIIQFSGQVLYEEDNQLKPVVYANIYIEGTQRGTYSDVNGFFSIVLKKTDIVNVSYLGFESLSYQIPDSLMNERYNMILYMSKDTLFLSTVEIYPWPSRAHFDIEFVAMDISDELTDRAKENLDVEVLREIREQMSQDGSENYAQYQKEQQEEYYSAGQYKPMQILNPLAWQKFIKEWKSGKYKSQKKK